MVVGINAYGASINPDPRVARNYSAPVEFTLTAPDGTKAVYKVTVKGAACLAGTLAPEPTPTPTPTPTPPACTAAPIVAAEKYSLVFKGCSVANVAEYYDKTECVRDNATGLIWQGQTAAGTGLRANDQYKTNFDSTTALQKYSRTDLIWIAPTQAEVDASTNSIGFKNAVNATNLCGSSAWRLPTKDELLGIVDSTATAAPSYINTTWFPNTLQYSAYWSSSPYPGYAQNAWFVGFHLGLANVDLRELYLGGYYYRVRLVR